MDSCLGTPITGLECPKFAGYRGHLWLTSRLVEVDNRSVRKEVISAMRMQVEVDTIVDIPIILSWEKGATSSVLVVEIESSICIVKAMQGVHCLRMLNLEVRDDELAITTSHRS